MHEQNHDSNAIAFKVRFLGEYHDVSIDWNDHKYSFKPQQLFKQLESITGILSKYNLIIIRHVTQLVGDWRPADVLNNNDIYGDSRNSGSDGSSFLDGERFHLKIVVCYDRSDYSIERVGIYYRLIPIDEVPEGVCSEYVCQYQDTKHFFTKIRDFINNDELNSKISDRIRAINRPLAQDWFLEMDKIYKEFNVLQYVRMVCDFHWRRDSFINGRNQLHFYFRTRG